MPALLEATDISKRFDGTQALRRVDFTLEEGEVHALLGENGAGKSTLSKIIAGVTTPDTGQIRLRGKPVGIPNPAVAQSLGIGMVFQELDLFPHLSVAENLAAANKAAGESVFVRRGALHRWCATYLEQVALDVDPATPLHALSVSEVQLVAIARALSLRARVLLMDEPTSSLSQANVEVLFGVIDRLKRAGVAIVYVSHKMAEVQRIADRLTVLRDGMRIATLRANEADVDELIRLMVGRPLERSRRVQPQHVSQDVLLDVRSLATDFVDGISFQLRAGEVLGIAGLIGSGRSEVGAALFGLRDSKGMDASLCGRPFAPACPIEAIERGLCLVPEDRRNEALFPTLSPVENTTIATLPRLSSMGLLHADAELAAATPLHHRLNLKGVVPNACAAALSGGNQQKAIIARWLMARPRVLFLDEPTRGIDVGAKEHVYRMVTEFAETGGGVVFVSSELPELFRCCDRILILHEGRQAAVVNAADATQEQILALAAGASRSIASND